MKRIWWSIVDLITCQFCWSASRWCGDGLRESWYCSRECRRGQQR